MELRIKPYDKNIFPLAAILVKAAGVEQWIKELQLMNLSLADVTVYPVPGASANTLWGCLVIGDVHRDTTDIRRNTWCQRVGNALFIPEKSILYPRLSIAEVEKLFGEKKHLLHPECGLIELDQPVDWKLLIEMPQQQLHDIAAPAATAFIPKQVKTFQVKPVKIEDVLEQFEETHFPKRQKFTDKPLNPFEKIKLFLYRQLFTKAPGENKEGSATERKPLSGMLESLKNMFSRKSDNWMNKLQMSYEELEKRNQKHLDRLLELLKNDPKEALKYAVPLDTEGTGRGGGAGLFDMQKRWLDFNLFGDWSRGGGSGTAIFSNDAYSQLHAQYMRTAQELLGQGEYRKAAFVYMKLLKNHYLAAQALEKGGHYQEAASVYLKYCDNKTKAAECFEKGNMISNAIELYKHLGENEKVADLYMSINKQKEAFEYYKMVADNYISTNNYVKASLVYRNKMDDLTSCQEALMKGWNFNRDAFNCLNNYFSNITDVKQLGHEIQTVYKTRVSDGNRETFLRILKYEFEKKNELSSSIKDMAHEIIAHQVQINPAIVSELHSFDKEDKQLIKDTLRFKLNAKNK